VFHSELVRHTTWPPVSVHSPQTSATSARVEFRLAKPKSTVRLVVPADTANGAVSKWPAVAPLVASLSWASSPPALAVVATTFDEMSVMSKRTR